MLKLPNKNTLSRAILALTLVYFLVFLFVHKEIFLKPFDYKYFGDLYFNSQYVQGPLSKGGIGDDGLFAFAGYYYITGGDISQVNFENPPLGKYMIGLSELIFKNEHTINIAYAILLFIIVYKLGLILLEDNLLASTATFFVSIDKVITNQFSASSLDLPQTVAFLLGFYFFLKAVGKPNFKMSLLAAFFFSISFVIKFFPFLPVYLLVVLLVLFLNKKKKTLYQFGASLIVVFPFVYLISHLSYFFNHSFLEFIKYQYWIIKWREGNAFFPGNFFPHLFFGRYFTWYGIHQQIRVSDEWSPGMSIISLLAFVGIFLCWQKGLVNKLCSITIIAFVVYVATLTTGSPKFLMSAYPLFAIAGVYTASEIYQRYIKKRVK